MRGKAEKPGQTSSADLATTASGSGNGKVSVAEIISALSTLRDRKGSTCSEIRNALRNAESGAKPTLLQVKTAIVRGMQEGSLKRADQNRFILDTEPMATREAKIPGGRSRRQDDKSSFGRRRRRRSRGRRSRRRGKGKGKGKGRRRGRRRRRRGRRGKGKGKGKGRKGRRGRRRRRRRRRGRGKKK